MAVLQGTLDMLILRTLLYGPAHEMMEAVARAIWPTAEES